MANSKEVALNAKNLYGLIGLLVVFVASLMFVLSIGLAYADEEPAQSAEPQTSSLGSLDAIDEMDSLMEFGPSLFEASPIDIALPKSQIMMANAPSERGGVTIQLYDADLEKAKPQAGGSFLGAWIAIKNLNEFDVEINGRTVSQGSVCTRLRTDWNGKATSATDLLPLGKYSWELEDAPEGYTIDEADEAAMPVEFTLSQEGEVTDIDPDKKCRVKIIRGGIWAELHDAETLLTTPQGGADFEGAQFTLTNLNDNAAYIEDEEIDRHGLYLNLLTADEQSVGYTTQDSLPYGHYELSVYDVVNGYRDSESSELEFDITEDGKMVVLDFYIDVYRKNVKGQVCRDSELKDDTSLGGASLEGATFEITSTSKRPVFVNGALHEPNEVCAVLTCDATGNIIEDELTLPIGQYTVKQTKAGEGYIPSDKVEYLYVEVEGGYPWFDARNCFDNQAKRSDLALLKVGPDQSGLEHVPFTLTSLTTGEQHTLITDENGYLSTESEWNPHTQSTNGNDEVQAEGYDDEAGVWFGQGSERSVEADDDKGALPYDYYKLEELPCASNEGLQLITLDNITVDRDGATVKLGTLVDEPKIAAILDSMATDGLDGDKLVVADRESSVVDTVSYGGLEPGEAYRLESKLVGSATGEPFEINDEAITQSTDLTPENASGEVEVNFNFDASGLTDDADVTVFETLYKGDELVCKHEDITDADSTVTIGVPAIDTAAHGHDAASKEIVVDESSKIVDTVSYSNLFPDETYKLTATLYSKSRRAPAYNGLDPITASIEFSPTESSGAVDVPIVFDATNLDDKELVVAEVLTKGDDRIAEHTSVDDKDQTVELVEASDDPAEPAKPTLDGTAIDAADGDKTLAASSVALIKDQVRCEGLEPGKSYRLVGTLYQKSTGAALVLESGNTTASQVFRADEASEELELSFSIATFEITGDDIVVYLELYEDDTLAASLTDLEDADQTVHVASPELSTVATDANDGDKEIEAADSMHITDQVSFDSLEPGKDYEINGKLVDKETGEPIKNGDLEVTGFLLFTPEASSGTVDVEYYLDATDLAGHELVVFETLSSRMRTVKEHADIDDEDQTVKVTVASVEPDPAPQEDPPDSGNDAENPPENENPPATETPAGNTMPTQSQAEQVSMEVGEPYAQTGVGATWSLWAAIVLGLIAGGSIVAYAVWKWRADRKLEEEIDKEIEDR